MDFYKTYMGEKFYNKTVPDLVTALNQLNKNMATLSSRMDVSKSAEQFPEDDGLHGLITILFETGDCTCPYWPENILCRVSDMGRICNLFSQADSGEDEDHHLCVERVMQNSGYPWKWHKPHSVIDSIGTVYVP